MCASLGSAVGTPNIAVSRRIEETTDAKVLLSKTQTRFNTLISGSSAMSTINCDRIAQWFELAERLSFWNALEQRRFAYLNRLKESRRAILCGEGDGRFLVALLEANPAIEITYIDSSRGMMRIAERRVRGLDRTRRSRVNFHCGNVMEFVPPHRDYDLVATHFFLDCFAPMEVSRLIARMNQWTHPRAKWLVSEFHYGESAFGRLWTSIVIRGVYAAFGALTGLRVNQIPRYAPLFLSAGFRLQESDMALGGLLISELWSSGSHC